MRRLALLISSLVVIGTIAAVVAGSSPGIVGVAYFREVTVAHANQGDFVGATEAWRTRVLLLHSPTVAGHGGIACIHVSTRLRECFGTYVLPRGRIKILGEIGNRTNYQLAIIGGTGVYTGANGVATFGSGLATFYIT